LYLLRGEKEIVSGPYERCTERGKKEMGLILLRKGGKEEGKLLFARSVPLQDERGITKKGLGLENKKFAKKERRGE